jgi:alpha-glucosidase (family GH31 glycosyl hydrolase)
VPIIDPGVKLDKAYDVYQRGRKEMAFYLNPQRKEFVGLVWPGETVFPDFSLGTARQWWAREVARFVRRGIQGAWLDMNDPATGQPITRTCSSIAGGRITPAITISMRSEWRWQRARGFCKLIV